MKKLCLVLCALSVTGCYNTRTVTRVQIHKLAGQQRHEIILRAEDGTPVRLGPQSKVRFQLANIGWTPWFRGRELRVNRVGICASQGCVPPARGWRWEQIRAIRIKNLAGGRTYAAVFISVAVAVATVALVAAMVGGKGGGGGSFKLGKLFPRGGARAFRGAGRSAGRIGGLRPRGGVRVGGLKPRGGPRVGGLRRRGGGRIRGHLVVDSLKTVPTDDPGIEVPETHSATELDAEPPPTANAQTAPQRRPVQSLKLSLQDENATRPLFTKRTRRRASIRFIGLVEGGGDLLIRDGGNAQALVGMRILDVLELAGGAHLMIHRGQDQPGALRTSWIGVARINLHFDVGARRIVALPIGFDLGGGHAAFYARLNLGLRVRLTRHLSIGIYPFNPTYAYFKDATLRRQYGWWSFPSTVDFSFAL